MEINQYVISEAIRKSSSCLPHDGLKQMFAQVEKLSVEDILLERNSYNQDKFVWDTLVPMTYRSFNTDEAIRNDAISTLASIVAFQKYYLNKAITDSNLKSLLIFLSINCYLKIKVNDLIDLNSFENTSILKLKEQIFQLINNFKVDIKALDDAPYHEKKSLDEYLDGLRNDDLEKVYRLVYAIERGKGFCFNYLIENLLDFLFQFDRQGYVETLINRKYPHEYILFLESISKDEILHLADETSINNKWLIFELIRKILPEERDGNFNTQEQTILKNVLLQLKKIDFQFFTKTIRHFSKSTLFNASLGNVLVELLNDEISHIIHECFVFDNYSFNLKARTKLLTAFTSQASEEKYIQLIKLTYEKWETFMSNLEKDKNHYQNNVILTDYVNYIVHYYIKCKTDVEIVAEIEKLIYILIHIDNIWFRNSSQQITIFFLNLSKLYLLSYAYAAKKISSSAHTAQVNELLSNPLIKSRFFTEKNSEVIISTIINNFNIKTE